MTLDQLIEEGEGIRDSVEVNTTLPGKRVDMERLYEFATKAVLHMEHNASDMSAIEAVREKSKDITNNNAYDRLIALIGILKGYRQFV